ncbi:hypothetical protein CEXT_496511 [Caerostris extrusa]|uniref:Uncharacterized protein n=1 Tax=Caerostris extrusa TaxID=172846 RepID=A0AAV4XVL5_CAEEX|nr:hypothetical protein CEXT_496511 [Caerostris extrusa]
MIPRTRKNTCFNVKNKRSPSGPVDLFYLFRKYSEGGNSSLIKLDLVHKWLEQANIYNDDTGVTKQYTEELFAEHSNNQDTMEFNDFLKFLHTISQEKNLILRKWYINF